MTRSTITAWLAVADVGASLLACVAAFLIRFHSGLIPVEHGLPALAPYVRLLPVIAVVWPLVFTFQGLYRPARGRTSTEESLSIVPAALLSTVAVFGIDAFYRLYYLRDVASDERFEYSRGFIAVFLAVDIVLTAAARALVRRRIAELRRHGLHTRRVLLVGAGDLGSAVLESIARNPQYGYEVVGFADDDPAKKGATIDHKPVLGTTDDVLGLTQQERVDELLIALPWSAHDKIMRILEEAAREGLNVKLVPDLLQFVSIKAGFEDLDGIPFLNLADELLSPIDRFLKRAVDIAGAGLGLLLLAPLMTLLALLVRRSSPGPVLYRQERIGLDGRRFAMYKFRTMVNDAEAQSGPVFAADDDPRATTIGRWLRRLSLDELPQLWNVLRGDMSIVGPRPERPNFVAAFKHSVPKYMHRHRMRSGITGWAQVNGWRGNTSIRKRIEYDLYYLRNWSLGLDFRIMCLTLVRGARFTA